MYEQNEPPADRAAAQQDAIDISDFVYAATGARVRRLTMPDGTHWSPAVDLCSHLGYANTSDAVHALVPAESRGTLETLSLNYRLQIPAGHRLKKSMNVVDLHGLIRLVGACTKPSAEMFKRWVTEVIVTVQREGSYALEEAEVQPKEPAATGAGRDRVCGGRSHSVASPRFSRSAETRKKTPPRKA